MIKRSQEGQSLEQSDQYDISKQEEIQRKKDQQSQFVVPNSNTYLKACIQCGLTKSKRQWQTQKNCENCGTFLKMQTNQNITGNIYGIFALIDPKKSFIKKKVRMCSRNGRKLKSGAYAI